MFATLPAVWVAVAVALLMAILLAARAALPVTRFRVGALVGLLLAAAVVGGCKRAAKTPEEAYHRVVEAVRTKDPERLYRALDLETRWSWMTIRRAHREAFDILLSNLPEGRERDQATRRFEVAAVSEDEVSLFREHLTDARWQELAAELGPSAPAFLRAEGKEGDSETANENGNEVEVKLPSGRSWHFKRGRDGQWGWSGLAAEADENKRRAIADLEIIRNNAADQERAATRAGR